MNRLTRHFTAWIACFALLFAALAPSVSHAMFAAISDANGEVRAEICTVNGIKFVNVNSAGEVVQSDPSMSDTFTQKTMHLEHCPFCLTYGSTFVLLPGAGLQIALLETQETHPSLFFQSPHPLAIWVTAQPRAPPNSI